MTWIDKLRRPRPRRLPGVRDALLARLLQPGLEGRRRCDPRGGRLAVAAADRDVRAAGLRLRRQDPDGRHLRRPRRGPRTPAACDARRSGCTKSSMTRSGGRRRAPTTSGSTGARSRSAASPRTPATSSSRASSRPSARGRVVQRPHGRRHVVRLGRPDVVIAAPGVQPVLLPGRAVWPHDNATTRRRLPPVRVHERGGARWPRASSTRQSGSSASGCPSCSPACRGCRGLPVPYLGANVPQAWAAGSVFRSRRDPVRPARDRGCRRLEALRQPGPAAVAPGGHPPEPPARVRLGATTPFRRRRGRRPEEHVRLRRRARAGARPSPGSVSRRGHGRVSRCRPMTIPPSSRRRGARRSTAAGS